MRTKKENQINKQRIIAQAQKRLDLVLKDMQEGKGIEIERTGLQKYHAIVQPFTGNKENYERDMKLALENEAKNLRKGQGLKVKIRKF
jgi:hypothetical protein